MMAYTDTASGGARIRLPVKPKPPTTTLRTPTATKPAQATGRPAAQAQQARPTPTRSNAGGAMRGAERAAQVHAMNAERRTAAGKTAAPTPKGTKNKGYSAAAKNRARIKLPSRPSSNGPDLRLPIPVPQIELFRDIGERIKQVTSPASRGRRR